MHLCWLERTRLGGSSVSTSLCKGGAELWDGSDTEVLIVLIKKTDQFLVLVTAKGFLNRFGEKF